MDYSDYKQIDKTDLQVPLLSEYLESCRQHNKKAYIEIKQPSRIGPVPKYNGPLLNEDDIKKLIWFVHDDCGFVDVGYTAFDQQELWWVHNFDPSIECWQDVATADFYRKTIGRSFIDDITSSEYAWLDWHISCLEVTNRMVRLIHKYNHKIMLWSFVLIDLPLTWRPFLNAGVDFILTDKDSRYVK